VPRILRSLLDLWKICALVFQAVCFTYSPCVTECCHTALFLCSVMFGLCAVVFCKHRDPVSHHTSFYGASRNSNAVRCSNSIMNLIFGCKLLMCSRKSCSISVLWGQTMKVPSKYVYQWAGFLMPCLWLVDRIPQRIQLLSKLWVIPLKHHQCGNRMCHHTECEDLSGRSLL